MMPQMPQMIVEIGIILRNLRPTLRHLREINEASAIRP